MPPKVWAEWLEFIAGGGEPWFELKRFKREVHAGDDILLWVSGKDSGARAAATVIDEPGPDPEISGLDYVPAPGAIWAPLSPPRALAAPLLRSEFRADPVLADAPIIHSAMGSIHQLHPPQAERVRALLASR